MVRLYGHTLRKSVPASYGELNAIGSRFSLRFRDEIGKLFPAYSLLSCLREGPSRNEANFVVGSAIADHVLCYVTMVRNSGPSKPLSIA